MLSYKIKPLNASDLAEAVDLIRRVFMEFVAPDCSPRGVEEFETFIELKSLRDKLSRSEIIFWGAYDRGGNLAGTIAGQSPGHIKYLFVEKRYHRQGIAQALLDMLRNHFHALGGRTLTVNSSPYAMEVYKKIGFRAVGPEKIVNGIKFTPMKAYL